MSATLEIINRFVCEVQGVEHSGKQGSADSEPEDAFDLTITGEVEEKTGTLATATARTVWDEDADNPSGFDYLHFWADQDCYIQLIGQTTNVTLKVTAKVPFVCVGQILAAASTTALSGAAPTLEDVDSVVIQNNSGSTMNYRLFVAD